MRCPIAVTALPDLGGPAPDLSLVITGAGEVKTVTPLSMFTGPLLMCHLSPDSHSVQSQFPHSIKQTTKPVQNTWLT